MLNKPQDPKISVCIPVYNGAKFIAASVESVLSQTFQDFELIIIDNDSTDGTAEIISRYEDVRIKFIRNVTNIGAMRNWNKAIRLARGEFVKILPADDLIYPDCLSKQVEALDAPDNAGVVIACCARDIINEKGQKIFNRSFGVRQGRLDGRVAIVKNIVAGTDLVGELGAVLFRKDALSKTGGFDDALPYAIDLSLWLPMLLLGDIYVFSETLCAFRVSRDSWSVSMAKLQSRDFCRFIDKLSLDKRYGLKKINCLQGKLMAVINEVLRRLFYFFVGISSPSSKDIAFKYKPALQENESGSSEFL